MTVAIDSPFDGTSRASLHSGPRGRGATTLRIEAIGAEDGTQTPGQVPDMVTIGLKHRPSSISRRLADGITKMY